MRISHTGGLIAAGSRPVALPMLQVGSIPIIERIVITFQQAGIFPIVIVTGANEEDAKVLCLWKALQSARFPSLQSSLRRCCQLFETGFDFALENLRF